MSDRLRQTLAGLDRSALAGYLITAAPAALIAAAGRCRDEGHGDLVSYSRKVFIPLTQLCRDACGYCTFAHPPRPGQRAYLTPEEVLAIARRGEAAGCREALFTLGDKPELRYELARRELAALGYDTTLDYLHAMAGLVLAETRLLPHLNPGVMARADLARLREVSVSMGIMLESAAQRLGGRGGPHDGCPDKAPAIRLATIAAAGELAVPFTSGILIGIGETRAERIESLLALRDLHERHGQLQEIIVQNFRAKPDTRMREAPEPGLGELAWTVAVTRLLFGPAMNIQVPPNLNPGALQALVAAGINDWGGVSPVTPDHVNPEAPWPHLADLARETTRCGKALVERLAIYPRYAAAAATWVHAPLVARVLEAADAAGLARTHEWCPGVDAALPPEAALAQAPAVHVRTAVAAALAGLERGQAADENTILALFAAHDTDFSAVCRAADDLRREVCGDAVSYVVNRNINYTNVCYFHCRFCAFSKGKTSANLRGAPYDLDLAEIARRSREAWQRGATEVCMQGGIHPDYTGATYLEIVRAVKAAVPQMHVHAFSPLEIWQGAQTLGVSLRELLTELAAAGLGTLPGTAAEILDDEVRQVLCPDKINTAQWLEVMRTAHSVGLRSTATIMYGHVERPLNWARHLLRLRDLQRETGGFTEFVPLPFVHMEAPIYRRGGSRRGPTFREAVLMHAVARLVLHPGIRNIQTSWVKMGSDGAALCLAAGANDIGGTLMNESITRAAGATHGQERPPRELEALIARAGRRPRQRTTLYGTVAAERTVLSYAAPPVLPIVNTPLRRAERA
ncbi:MAG: 5-amino-6-(D-ribitylamino)uracil--L-tyrosine 4-hydroxyphenyl transferase CofH [Gammaproteobacteria bacterium]|nr:5-amino-6-(D-ribitylamino)uracil--L-tyrosine 4-hydroxyphenyl transferase CofH [Gammaproteobacteria bacterium]